MQRLSLLFYINLNNNMVAVRICCLAFGLMVMCEVVAEGTANLSTCTACLLQLNSHQHGDDAKLKDLCFSQQT
jgi:hypothetical protein